MSSEDLLLKAICYRGADKKKFLSLLPPTSALHSPGEIRDGSNRTLLHWAAKRGWTDVCQLLVEKYQVDPHCEDDDGWTALHCAAINGWTDTCQLLIERYQVDPHCETKDWYTALHYTCIHNKIGVVKYLVSTCCCDPLAINYSRTNTPFSDSRGETRFFLQEIIETSKEQEFASVVDYLKHSKRIKELMESAIAEAMAEGGGDLFQYNLVFHGPPGAGKSSVKLLILGQPPRPKHKQSATNILEKSVRTVCVDRVAAAISNKQFVEVSNDDIISRIAGEVEKHRQQNKHDKKSYNADSTPLSSSNIGQIRVASVEPSDSADVTTDLPSADESVQNCYRNRPALTTKAEESLKKKLLDLKKSQSSNGMFDSRWFHHIDSGGQPQFLDVFPLMYRSPSHFIEVMRLTEGLDEKPKVRFYNKGNDMYCLPDHLVLTNREMIIRMCQIAQRIARATDGKFVPRVFVVGTHKDKLLPILGHFRQKNINSELLRIHEKYSDVLVCKVPGEQVMFTVNAMAEGKERQQYTEEFQEHILAAIMEHADDPIKVPLKWLIFHLELGKGEGVVRMSECCELGRRLGMSEEKVHVALEFLNKAALVLYYPEDVPDLVLANMNPFTNRLSRLIKASFIPPDNGPVKECIELREKGVFKKTFLKRVFRDLEENHLSNEEFLKLLESLKIAVNVGGEKYFLPSALSLEPPRNEPLFDNRSTPLTLLWGDHILPHGLFLTVCVELQNKSRREKGYVLELRGDIVQWRGEIQLSEADRKIPGVVKLTDRQTWIQVSYSGDNSYCPTVHHIVISATQRAIDRLRHTGIRSPTIGCVCTLCDQKDHYCYLSEDRHFITCSINDSKTGPVTTDMSCWFEEKNNVPLSKGDCEQAEYSPTLAVFNRHTPELLGVVSDTDSLIANLITAGIIAKDNSFSNDTSRYQRVEMILNTVKSSLVNSSNPQEILVKFSIVLKNQQNNNETLRRISTEMRSQLVLSQSPSVKDVYDLVRGRAASWEDIGIELEVGSDYRDQLRTEGVMSSDSIKLERVLRKWAESKCSNVTWSKVIEVLSVLQFNDEVNSTKRFLKREDIVKKYTES